MSGTKNLEAFEGTTLVQLSVQLFLGSPRPSLPEGFSSVFVAVDPVEGEVDEVAGEGEDHLALVAEPEVARQLLVPVEVTGGMEGHVGVVQAGLQGPVVDQGVRRLGQKD